MVDIRVETQRISSSFLFFYCMHYYAMCAIVTSRFVCWRLC